MWPTANHSSLRHRQSHRRRGIRGGRSRAHCDGIRENRRHATCQVQAGDPNPGGQLPAIRTGRPLLLALQLLTLFGIRFTPQDVRKSGKAGRPGMPGGRGLLGTAVHTYAGSSAEPKGAAYDSPGRELRVAQPKGSQALMGRHHPIRRSDSKAVRHRTP